MFFIFKTIVRWRKFIIIAGLASAVLAAVVSLLLPKWYTATTSVFPPDNKSSLPVYSELIESLQVPLLGPMGSGLRPETVYIDILLSRTVGKELVEEFDLKHRYGVEIEQQAIEALHSHTRFNLLENGILQIHFEDTDPQRAADVANRYVALLDEFNRQLNVSRASKTREFIAGQLKKRESQLADAEAALKEFQERHEALELDQQLHTAMEIVGDLTGQAIALETELDILKHYTSTTSDEYIRKKTEYDEVIAQLKRLKMRPEQDEEDLLRAYIPSLADIPVLALDMLRLKRAVEIETTVYTLLVKEYEKAQIEEARDTPTVQLLDRAEAPALRSRPKRKALVIVGGVVGLGWSALIALLVTAWRENKERSRVISEVFDPVVNDISRLLRRK